MSIIAVDNMNGTITLSEKDFDFLLSRDNWLCELENAGVDNWDGYEYAREAFNEENN